MYVLEGSAEQVLRWHVIVLGWLGGPAEDWRSTWCCVKRSLEFESCDGYCCPGCWAELVHCLAATLPHVLLKPDNSGSSSLHMCLCIYIHTHTFIRLPLELSLHSEECRYSLKSLVPQLASPRSLPSRT